MTHLADYYIGPESQVRISEEDQSRDTTEACPDGSTDGIRTLVLYSTKRGERGLDDEMKIIADLLRAGFVVLAIRRASPVARGRDATVFLVDVQ